MEGLALTADHAARGKHAAVSEGYWSDAFVGCFSRGGFDASPGPLINRGQYARVAAIASAIEQFLSATAGQAAQIVSLGAGFDTCFWQLQAAGAAPRLYVELDQDDVVRAKCSQIAAKPMLHRALAPEGAACVTPNGISSGSSGYRLLPVDLNDVAQLERALSQAGWTPSQPTLVIAECVLVYMVPEASRAIVDFFGKACARAVLVAYEMVGPDDPFGRTMLQNLRRRGCPLLGLSAVPTVQAQQERCLSCGWSRAEAMEMLAFFDQVVGPDERARVCRIGLLDELEEWRMLLSHYCVALAVLDDAASPIFGNVTLRRPANTPPLAALATASNGSAANGTAANATEAEPVAVPTMRRPPLGDTFDEADEAAVWSDEEESVEAVTGQAEGMAVS